ncbi:MAG: thiamine-phosphate kinase [Gemmataceae bacterium]|nr:thiamine-phosphate kinase [Gemmataceae bacterium]
MSEFRYIDWLRKQTPAHGRVLLGPGDDAAAVAWHRDSAVLLTTDILTDGVDFRLEESDPRRIGRKAIAVNLSDIAAMAGQPVAAVVGVVLPQGCGADLPEELYRGMRQIADEFDMPIVGGDTNSWPGKLVLSVTVVGEITGRGPVTRSGARPGDWLFATGSFGQSILGHHFDFTPRVREAQALHASVDLHAMIDVSDGLAADLHHICEESRCGAILYAERIPRRNDAELANALADGEDFELVFAVAPSDGEKLLRDPPIPGLSHIGVCVESGLWIEQDGTRAPLPPTGWVHSF